MLEQLILLVLLLGVLGYSAGWVIRSLVELGRRFNISEFVLGFVVIGIATSLPELSVGVNSIIKGTPGLSLGNLLGASLVLLSLIVGLAAVLQRGIFLGHSLRSRDLVVGSALIAAPIFMLVDGRFSPLEGWFLIFLYASYLLYLYFNRVEVALRTLDEKRFSLTHLLVGGIFGLIGLVVASHYIVNLSLEIAQVFQIKPLIVGVLILGIGTNLPEIALVLRARRTGAQKLVLGDLLGSAAANTLIIGIVGIGTGVVFTDQITVLIAGLFLFTLILLFNIFIRTKAVLSVVEGVILLLIYLIFVGLQLFT
ncbi:MAG: hypothetical protein ABIJ81_00915 [Patescibacteria group bacterium]